MRTTERERGLKPFWIALGAILLGLVLADVLKFWVSANLARAVAFFIGTICLGAVNKLHLSWRRLICAALGIGAFAFLFGSLHDLLLNYLRK